MSYSLKFLVDLDNVCNDCNYSVDYWIKAFDGDETKACQELESIYFPVNDFSDNFISDDFDDSEGIDWDNENNDEAFDIGWY